MERLLFPVRKPQNERGVDLLEHQAGPDHHDLPLVLDDPESGEEGLKKEFWSLFYTRSDVIYDKIIPTTALPVRWEFVFKTPFGLDGSLNCAITSV